MRKIGRNIFEIVLIVTGLGALVYLFFPSHSDYHAAFSDLYHRSDERRDLFWHHSKAEDLCTIVAENFKSTRAEGCQKGDWLRIPKWQYRFLDELSGGAAGRQYLAIKITKYYCLDRYENLRFDELPDLGEWRDIKRPTQWCRMKEPNLINLENPYGD